MQKGATIRDVIQHDAINIYITENQFLLSRKERSFMQKLQITRKFTGHSTRIENARVPHETRKKNINRKR